MKFSGGSGVRRSAVELYRLSVSYCSKARWMDGECQGVVSPTWRILQFYPLNAMHSYTQNKTRYCQTSFLAARKTSPEHE